MVSKEPLDIISILLQITARALQFPETDQNTEELPFSLDEDWTLGGGKINNFSESPW